MESSSAGGRNGGLRAKAGVNGDDHFYNRKVPLGFAGHRRLTESISRQSLYVCKIWLSLTVVVSHSWFWLDKLLIRAESQC